jgi:hypothetical protein
MFLTPAIFNILSVDITQKRQAFVWELSHVNGSDGSTRM